MSTSGHDEDISSRYRADRPIRRQRLALSPYHNAPAERLRDVVKKVIQQNRQKGTYTYEPIDHHNEFRILRILHGKEGSGLECTLFPSSFRSTRSTTKSKCYNYCALSYTWGDRQPTYRITIYPDIRGGEGDPYMTPFNKSGTFNISHRLAVVLQALRREDQDVNVWAAAVCIDQANDVEKNAQVAIMYKIYSEATAVCDWVGTDDLEALETLDFLMSIKDLKVMNDLLITKARAENWMLVIKLMKQSWLSGRWVIPEEALGTPKNAVILWGPEGTKPVDLDDALSLFVTNRDVITDILEKACFYDSSIKSFFEEAISRSRLRTGLRTKQSPWVDITSPTKPEDAVDGEVLVNQFASSGGNPVRLEVSGDSDSDFSITSLESSAALATASSATSLSDMAPVARYSATEILYLISNDDQLRKLLEKAFNFLDPERVTRNFRRALRSFSQDLMHEAETQLQKQAAKFVGEKSRQIALLVREKLHPSKHMVLPSHDVDIVRAERLQHFIKGGPHQTGSVFDVMSVPVGDALMDDDSDEGLENDDSEEHPDLIKLREWFLSANAMQRLRDRFLLFLYPEKPTTADKSGDKVSTSDSETMETLQDGKELPLDQQDDGLQHEAHEEENKDSSPMGSHQRSIQSYAFNLSFLASTIWNYIDAKKPLEPGLVRLE